MQALRKYKNIKNYIKKDKKKILFFKHRFIKNCLFNWQKSFIKKTFFYLYFWYIYLVNITSLVIFMKYYIIFFSFFEKRKKNI